MKSELTKIVLPTVIAISLAALVALFVSTTSRDIQFKSNSKLAVADFQVTPGIWSSSIVKMSGLGTAVYASTTPRVDVLISTKNTVLIDSSGESTSRTNNQPMKVNVLSEKPEIVEETLKNDDCEVVLRYNRSATERDEEGKRQAGVVSSKFYCEFSVSDMNEDNVSVYVTMWIRGVNENADRDAALIASGSYTIDSGWLPRLIEAP